MNQNYNDDANRQLTQQQLQQLQQLQQQLQQQHQAKNSFMDWIRNNKWLVLLAALIILALLYWFCMRKKAAKTLAGTAANANATRLQVTKTRVGNGNAGAVYA